MANSKSKEKRKFKNGTSFIREYKWWFIISAVILVVAYVLIYVCFLGSGVFPVGEELEKKDWLAFLSAYLSFAGTSIISLIAILQSKYYSKMEKERIDDERRRAVQPILSISIMGNSSQITGVVDVVSTGRSDTLPQYSNATIEIENVGQYPICNVFVFDIYLWQTLKPNEKKQIQVAYPDSPSIECGKKNIIEIFESEFGRTETSIPEWFNVNYDDADGNAMFQTFELIKSEGTMYYSLEGTHNS